MDERDKMRARCVVWVSNGVRVDEKWEGKKDESGQKRKMDRRKATGRQGEREEDKERTRGGRDDEMREEGEAVVGEG